MATPTAIINNDSGVMSKYYVSKIQELREVSTENQIST
jgi:hypothetical protein